MKKVLLIILVFISLSVCSDSYARNDVFIDANMDSDYSLSKKHDKIFVLIPDAYSIEKREFGKLLRSEMRNNGFHVLDEPSEATIFLIYNLHSKTDEIEGSYPVPTSAYTSGNINITGSSGFAFGRYSESGSGTAFIPTSESYTVKVIQLQALSADEAKAGEQKVIWEGFLSSEDNVYDKHLNKCIAKLLSYYGERFKGNTKAK